jgi:DNA-binding MarR family transcriptional regulator
MSSDDWTTAVAVLGLATELVEGIQEGVARRGFGDVRPAHGFAFARISYGDATTAKVAEHLGVTKQAGAQLVEYLVHHGYVERRPDPCDARARLLVLTGRGRACTEAAEAAAVEAVDRWRSRVSESAFRQLTAALHVLADQGRLRPTW